MTRGLRLGEDRLLRPRAESVARFAHTRVVVDNSKGAEPEFAASLRDALSGAGFHVELREPSSQARYDTMVHLVVEGVAIRVSERPERAEISTIAAAVREAEWRRRSARARYRAVPIYEGETSRVLEWVDVFG